ncbi:ubiquitin carboxyl-terminal hydrolase 10-like [Pollicipes pollicipes]|uniref:ubiquitin carboxyl-terminal hydrolase 10-like n=1 Tax=Pollicipes pollicipes TaxID=41117 RepID=UPI001884C015|nr:ubiquitin carboxyl-terminal hydrolase 10-like [Pollicipes pollicipes]
MPHVTAQHPAISHMVAGGAAPLYQQQAGYPFPNMFVNSMPPGVNMMYPMPGGYPLQPPAGYGPEPVSGGDQERRRSGKKADKMAAIAGHYSPYHITTSAATGHPLVMPFPNGPYGQVVPLPYHPYPYAYPSPEMMMAAMQPPPPQSPQQPLPPPPQHSQQSPPPPGPRSWASLFQTKAGDAPVPPPAAAPPKPAPAPPTSAADTGLLSIGAVLSRFELSYKNVYLQPRGLTNKSNWCYINATLQALASCTPFYHLMKSLPSNIGLQADNSRTPIIDAVVEFMNEFSSLPELQRVKRRERERGHLRDMAVGPPFEPSYVYAMLSRVSSDAFRVAGRQEDAEEFLTCLLSGLQDEMTEVLKVYKKSQEEVEPAVNGSTNGDADHQPDQDDGDSDDWQTIIGKNRGQVTRSAELQTTPVSSVFSGQLRSSLHRHGTKATATVQSFFSLQLDIQSPQVSSVEQALEALVGRDQVVGLTCPQSGQPVDAWQQAALEVTPPILILHLKRFLYDPANDGVQKLLKRVTFPVDLELKKELLSNVRGKMAPGPKRYRLFAVIYHSGKESTKGHYITDAYHPAYQQWVRYDDSLVSAVAEAAVLRPEPPLVPYILFYRRLDTVAAHNGK